MNNKRINKYVLSAIMLAPICTINSNYKVSFADDLKVINTSVNGDDDIAEAINNATTAVNTATTTPTTSNINAARALVNALPESDTKNNLQAELNAISNITDFTLDRNSASANVDIYIKCENMLSLSLSTNSVTFEEFSGTEDMEKLNAVGVTVDSSLNYDLNAYLATNISSAAGNTINLDKFGIKDSNTSDYKFFTTVGTAEDNKLVLLSNQTAGEETHNIDLKLFGSDAHVADVYKTTIKFEAVQK